MDIKRAVSVELCLQYADWWEFKRLCTVLSETRFYNTFYDFGYYWDVVIGWPQTSVYLARRRSSVTGLSVRGGLEGTVWNLSWHGSEASATRWWRLEWVWVLWEVLLWVSRKLLQSYMLTGNPLTGKLPATNITGNLRTLYW